MIKFHAKRVDFAAATGLLNTLFPPPQETTTRLRDAFIQAYLSATYEVKLENSIEYFGSPPSTKDSAEIIAGAVFMLDNSSLVAGSIIHFQDPLVNEHYWVKVNDYGANIVVYHESKYTELDKFRLHIAPDMGLVRQLCGVRELPLKEHDPDHLITAARMFGLQLGNDQESINLFNRHPMDFDLSAIFRKD